MARKVITPDYIPATHHAVEGRRPFVPAEPRREVEAAAQIAARREVASAAPRSTHRSPNCGGMGGCRASGG